MSDEKKKEDVTFEDFAKGFQVAIEAFTNHPIIKGLYLLSDKTDSYLKSEEGKKTLLDLQKGINEISNNVKSKKHLLPPKR